MYKLCFYCLFFCVFYCAQKKAISPFSIDNYINLKKEYLAKVLEKKDDLLFLENTYYSKQKLDSLLLIKDKFKHDYWLENGKKADEITDKDLNRINDDIVLPYAIFRIKEKNYEFHIINYDYSPIVFIETNDGKSISFTFNDDAFVEGISDKISKLNTANYYYTNGKLKRTETIFNNTKKISLLQEFDASGKITLEIDWDKDFKISEKEAQNIAYNEISNYLKINHKKDFKGDLNLKEIRIYKILNEKNQPVWFSNYNNFKLILDAKTGKVVKIFEEISVP